MFACASLKAKLLIAILIGLFTQMGSSGYAEVLGHITLKDGSLLYGEIIGMKGGILKARAASSLSNPVLFKWQQVDGLATESPITLVLDNGETVIGIVKMAEPGLLKLQSDLFEASMPIALSSVVGIRTPALESADGEDQDEIYLKDGSHITGTVLSMEDDKLKIETAYTDDDIIIEWEDVEMIVLHDPLPVVMLEEEVTDEDHFAKISRNKMKTIKNTDDFSLDQVESINIPKIRHESFIDLGGSRLTGNTNTAATNASLGLLVMTRRHRFDLSGKYNFASASGVETANNARANLRYDYFVTRRMFIPIIEFLEQDQFQGLNARSTTGIGVGYQFLDKSSHKLGGYTGPAFVYEDFVETGKTLTPTWAWALKWEYDVIVDKVSVFHNQQGFRDFGGDKSMAIRFIAEQGIRVELFGDLYFKLEFDWRFNSEPEPGKAQSDETLIWGLGYKYSN